MRNTEFTAKATFLNSTTLLCTLPSALYADIMLSPSSSTTWILPMQLLAYGGISLYACNLVVAGLAGEVPVVSSVTSVPVASLSRTIFSYSTASSLTPSPVISGSSTQSFVDSNGLPSPTPLQLHSQLTQGLSFIVQQTQMAGGASTSSPALINAVQSALSGTTDVGINDVYAFLSSAATISTAAGSSGTDLNSVYNSVVSSVSLDGSALPQILTITGDLASPAALALDIVGSQAHSWLIDNFSPTTTPTDLLSSLNQGVTLPTMSDASLQQLSSLTLSAALNTAVNLPGINDVLTDPTISSLIGIRDNIDTALNDPASLITDLLPDGSVKSTLFNIFTNINQAEDDVNQVIQFAGNIDSLSDDFVNSIGDAASDLIDTVSSVGSSFMDAIAQDAVSASSLELAGPIGSLAGSLAGLLGASPPVQNVISGCVAIGGGVTEILCGDVVGGIGDVVSGLGHLFGLGGGPDETQLLAQQMSKDFSQVFQDLKNISTQISDGFDKVITDLKNVQTNLLAADQQLSQQLVNGFGELANLTIAGFTSLQQQQYTLYNSEMTALGGITTADNAISITLQNIENQISALQDVLNANDRSERLGIIDSYTSIVQSALTYGLYVSSPSSTTSSSRMVSSQWLLDYEENMDYIAEWAYSANGAAALSMSGDPTAQPFSGQIDAQLNYDLAFALLPTIVSSYLSLPLLVPATLPTAGSGANLPNPFAWAYATNAWLEGRQAALQTPVDIYNIAVSNLWATGTQLQTTFKLAVSQQVLTAASNVLQSTVNNVLASLNNKISLLNLDSGVGVTQLLYIMTDPAYAAFDEAGTICNLLVTMAIAAGLGSNSASGSYYLPSQLPQDASLTSFSPATRATKINPFAAVTSTSTLATALATAINTAFLNSSGLSLSDKQQVILFQTTLLLKLTTSAMTNAIASFYCPCSPSSSFTSSRTIPVIDTTLRRLAGFMTQQRIPFRYLGSTVHYPPTVSVSSLLSSSSSSSSTGSNSSPATLSSTAAATPTSGTAYFCAVLVGSPGTVDYPWTSYSWAQFNYVAGSQPQSYALTNITGFRVFINRYNTVSYNTSIVSLSGTPSVLYGGSSSTTGALDGKGISYFLAYPIQLPGTSPSQLEQVMNLFYSSSLQGVQESRSAFINAAQSLFYTNLASLQSSNYQPAAFLSSATACASLVPAFLSVSAPSQITRVPARSTALSYTATDGLTWSAQVTLRLSLSLDAGGSPIAKYDNLGNLYYVVSSVLSAGSFRTYQFGGATVASNFSYSATQVGVSAFFCTTLPGDQFLYTVSPYLDSQGITYQTLTPLPVTGTNAPATTTVFTVYQNNGTLQEIPLARSQATAHTAALTL